MTSTPSSAPSPGYLPATAPSSGMATASLIFGIIGLFTGIGSIFAVVFGHIGLNQTRDGARSGRGMAVAGLVMGYIVLIPWLILMVLMMLGAVASPFTS
jgi:hypothetical protein